MELNDEQKRYLKTRIQNIINSTENICGQLDVSAVRHDVSYFVSMVESSSEPFLETDDDFIKQDPDYFKGLIRLFLNCRTYQPKQDFEFLALLDVFFDGRDTLNLPFDRLQSLLNNMMINERYFTIVALLTMLNSYPNVYNDPSKVAVIQQLLESVELRGYYYDSDFVIIIVEQVENEEGEQWKLSYNIANEGPVYEHFISKREDGQSKRRRMT